MRYLWYSALEKKLVGEMGIVEIDDNYIINYIISILNKAIAKELKSTKTKTFFFVFVVALKTNERTNKRIIAGTAERWSERTSA